MCPAVQVGARTGWALVVTWCKHWKDHDMWDRFNTEFLLAICCKLAGVLLAWCRGVYACQYFPGLQSMQGKGD